MKTFFLIYAASQVLIVLFFAGVYVQAERRDREPERSRPQRVTATGPKIGRK